MALIRNGQYAADKWGRIGDGDDLPATGAVIIPLASWAELRQEALTHEGPIGISIEPSDDLSVIVEDLSHFGLITITFPAFKDGRGFSLARLLRERHGYKGELRAVGHLIYDQLQFLSRCGFDAVDLPPHLAAQDWLEALGEISVFYQATGDNRPDVLALRHGIASEQSFASAAE